MDHHRHLMKALADLFDDMDRAYDEVARQCGFECNGCEDNCCRTRFHHHTLAEYLFLKEGLACLSDNARQRVAKRAVDVMTRMRAAEAAGRPVKEMCPLNEDERCLLYASRPMICRLHGIAHQLRRPDGQIQSGPGCGDFDRQCGPQPKAVLDRTPLYTAMAQIERQLRSLWDYHTKIKMTIAEMVVAILDEPGDGPLSGT